MAFSLLYQYHIINNTDIQKYQYELKTDFEADNNKLQEHSRTSGL